MKTPQVLILAGGEGKRFWPLSQNKALYQFLGQSLLAHNLTRLADAGFSQATIVTSPESQQAVSQIKVSNLAIKTAVQAKPLGMADAVLSAQKSIADEPLLIMNATDLVNPYLYHSIYQALQGGKNILVSTELKKYFPGAYFKFKDEQIEAIVEKPGAGNQPSNFYKLVFDGFQKPQEFINLLKKSQSVKDDAYEVALSALIKKVNFGVIRYTDYWQPTKFPWDILSISDLMLKQIKQKISAQAKVSPQATILGDVVIEAGVTVSENAIIAGPAYVGKNSLIGWGSLVRQSIIGEDCVVGYNCEITRSWLGNKSWLHSNFVGDSVLESDVSLGAGAILANLRLDEKEIHSRVQGKPINTARPKLGAIIGSKVRIGVNTSVMPGIKIGTGTFIGANLIIDQDIPDKSFVSGETKLKIEKNRESVDASAREEFKKNL